MKFSRSVIQLPRREKGGAAVGHRPVLLAFAKLVSNQFPCSAENQWHNGRADTNQYDGVEVVAQQWQVAHEITGSDQQKNPQGCANDVKYLKFMVTHIGYAGDKRRERSDNWQETRQYNGLAAVFFIESVRAL